MSKVVNGVVAIKMAVVALSTLCWPHPINVNGSALFISPMPENSSQVTRSPGNLTFRNVQIIKTAIVASITRQAAIASGEKSANAIDIHKNEVPHKALTSSSLATSRAVGGLITVKILP